MSDCLKFGMSWLDSVDVNASPVQVVESHPGRFWEFPNLAAAQQMFPELDPYQGTSRFTWAMRGVVGHTPALRFETWTAYEIYACNRT